MLRWILRGTGWVLLLLLVLLALLSAAWLPFNLRDVGPKPRPAELRMPAARLADDRNAAYAVVGLLAESGRDPAATGRAVWAAHQAWGALPPGERAAAAAGRAARIDAATGKMLATPKGAPWACSGNRAACDADWLAAADALAAQRAAHAVFGQRCEQLVDGPFEFEELLPPGKSLDAPLMPWQPLMECSRWLRSAAVLALARGQRAEALAQLRRSERMQRQAGSGARTLIGHMVAARMARNHYDTMAVAAMRDPALIDAMAPWIAGPLDTRPGAGRWIVVEAAYQQALLDELGGAGGAALAMSESPMSALTAGPGLAAMTWLGQRGIGFHRQRTGQQLDGLWQRRLAHLQYEWPAIVAGAVVEERAERERGFWGHVKWRNTFGEAIVDIAMDTGYAAYFARHADHELHREATGVVLALQRQRVAAAQRADATKRLPGLGNTLKERLTWSADGQTLSVKPWQSEVPAGYDARRDAITFSWPTP